MIGAALEDFKNIMIISNASWVINYALKVMLQLGASLLQHS
jgi:hypothetical protein